MSTQSPAASSLEHRTLTALHACAAVSLAVITLWHPATTRMWAWPWSIALTIALLFPAAALVIRALLSRAPLALPSAAWCGLALASADAILASALASPYRAASLRWSAPLLGGLAVFFLAYDWLARGPARAARLRWALILGFLPLGLASTGWWFARLQESGLAEQMLRRNPYPLGHANYTAGLALLVLPTAAVMAWQQSGLRRALAGLAALLALLLLFSSSSRGGLVALALLAAAGLWRAPFSRRGKIALGAVAALLALAVVAANPRARALFSRAAAEQSAVAASTGQRDAMLTAAWRMGAARPVLGWGPGTTPLAYPRFRGGLAGGAENVLQLHSLPAHLFAECGVAGLAGLLGFGLLVFRRGRCDAVDAVTLAGYGVFALTDWQLDIPVFAALVATFAALAASRNPPATPARRSARLAVGATTLGAVALIGLFGKRDPTPELNGRALELAREPAGAAHAVALLRASLALNPDQEIAHFNLGWLLVVREPAAAERHFLAAARLVPDKGGVYFGLGLARLNQGRRAAAARALALECLDDARFKSSGWWREPALAALRPETAAAFRELLGRAHRAVAPTLTFAQFLRVNSIDAPAPPRAPGDEIGDIPAGPEYSYRRTRTGYPVLMRSPDLPAPVDLFDVRETIPPDVTVRPPKGWLPSPLLLALLDEPVSPKP